MKEEMSAAEGDGTDDEAARVSKRDFVRLVAKRAGVTISVTDQVYEALLAEVVDQVRRGVQVNFSGFGRFYPQVHKDHHAQFGAVGQDWLPDYTVLKFGASRTLSDFLALDDEVAADTRVPGTVLYLAERNASKPEAE